MIKLIIFDLDGTLIDTSTGLNVCMNEALKKLGLPQISQDETKRFVGNGIKKYCERAIKLNDYKVADECFSLFMDYYRQGWKIGCSLYDGMDTTLETLKNADIKLAILSNKAQEMTLKFYNEFLKNYSFDYVLGNVNGAPLKPDPYGAEKILETLNVNKQYALLTGDGETDVLTAKNAAISSLSALWGFRSESELKNAGATLFVKKPIEILKYALND